MLRAGSEDHPGLSRSLGSTRARQAQFPLSKRRVVPGLVSRYCFVMWRIPGGSNGSHVTCWMARGFWRILGLTNCHSCIFIRHPDGLHLCSSVAAAARMLLGGFGRSSLNWSGNVDPFSWLGGVERCVGMEVQPGYVWFQLIPGVL